jgi:tagatose-6-phosphate ketose/aldose isomerase
VSLPALQRTLGRAVSAVPAGLILTHPETCLPPSGSFLVVSLARSGNSPESRAAVDWLLESRPEARHLLITCNREGALATSYAARREVRTIVLDEKTNDRSLVMTSSFTNLVLAGLALAGAPQASQARASGLARAAAGLLRGQADAIAGVARGEFGSVVYLGSGCRLGSAREAALKMLEMNGGNVWTHAESYLGLRHGPMSAIRPDTLVVAFLSSDPTVRAYERDLLGELDRKALGARRVVVGAGVPPAVDRRPWRRRARLRRVRVRGRGPHAARRARRPTPRLLPLPGCGIPSRLALGAERDHTRRLRVRDPQARRGEVMA